MFVLYNTTQEAYYVIVITVQHLKVKANLVIDLKYDKYRVADESQIIRNGIVKYTELLSVVLPTIYFLYCKNKIYK